MVDQRASASPSPAPQAPVAAAPGPRAAKLNQVFTGALSSSLKANSYANFSACFPTPARYCPTALEGVWKQLNTRLEEECQRDFEKILAERSVVEGLNQWDMHIDDARRRKNRSVEGEEPSRPCAQIPSRWTTADLRQTTYPLRRRTLPCTHRSLPPTDLFRTRVQTQGYTAKQPANDGNNHGTTSRDGAAD